MDFRPGPIQDVLFRPLRRFEDPRGWLAEIFRADELPPEFHPVMTYVSLSLPGVVRGPHEHRDQADLFAWVGPGEFKVTLWDNRPESPAFGHRMELRAGESQPSVLLIPKGVVHCYRCISLEPGLVFNGPNRLYGGEGRAQPVDEIRHEEDPESPFVLDERSRRDRTD